MYTTADTFTPKILVVNDAPDMLELIALMLKNEGFQVLTAADGQEAMQIALTHLPAAIISDVVMPVMDGMELCSQIKSDPRTAGIPVLLASALRTDEQDSLFGLHAGADDYLELPFRKSELLIKLTRLIERSRMERALRDSERRYRTLYEDSPLMYFVLDHYGVVMSVNQTGIERLGYSEDELVGKSVFNIFYPADRPKLAEQIENLRKSPHGLGQWEFRKVHKKGNIVFVSENVRLLPQANGDSMFLVICEDVTERKHTLAALQQSETRYQTVIESAAVIFFALDCNGIFTLSEGASLKKLNLAPGEVVGKSVFEYYQDQPEVVRNMRRALDGESFTATVEISKVVFEVSYNALHDADDKPNGAIGVATDITERVAAERKAAEVIVQLGATVEREAVINRISNAVRESLKAEDVFRAVVTELGRHLEIDRCHLYLFDEATGMVSSMAQFAAPEVSVVPRDNIPFALANRILPAFRETGYVAIRDVAAAAAIKELYDLVLGPRGVRSIMFVEIRVRNELTGLLSLVTTTHHKNWSSSDIALAQAVADQAGVAIRQAELYSQAEIASQRERLINNLSTAIRSSLQLPEVLHAATHGLGEAVSASRVFIRFFYESQSADLMPAEYVYTASPDETPLPPPVSIQKLLREDLAERRKTLVVNDTLNADDLRGNLVEHFRQNVATRGVRSGVYCPIWVNDDFRGSLCIEQTDRLRRWTESDVALVESVAAQLALGIAHAELFELTRRAKREWEVTFDAMRDGVFIFDDAGLLQRVNRAGAAVERSAPEDLIGKSCCELLPTENESDNKCVVQQVIETKTGITVEQQSKILKRPLLITAEPIFGETEKLVGVVGTVRDLYELREAEAVARERQTLLTHILEGILEPIFAVDETGKLLWSNNATRESYGFDATEIVNRNFADMVHPEDRPMAEAALAASLKKQSQFYESRYLTAKGETRYAVFNSVPLVIENVQNGVLWFVRDITQQKMALQQALQADKLRALGQLASGVAHDFNNGLAAILGRVGIMQRQSTDEGSQRNLQIIQTAAEDAAATVRRIQAFARQSAMPDFSVVEVGSLLRDSIELTRTNWEGKSVRAGFNYSVELAADGTFYAQGNASELREVFINLIVNALDAMPNGGNLKIECAESNNFIELRFEDNGEGIPEEVRERIFEPFFSTKGLKGMGLGLSVSYGIIKQHNGKISVESEIGKGTVFSISLPSQNLHQTTTKPVMLNQPKKELSILIVDDEDFVREALIEMVSELATDVEGATDGRQALLKLDSRPFDVVFTDYSMPEMDGLDLARAIRHRWSGTKTVLVTGYGKGVPLSPEKRELVYTIIGKPFSFEQLSETLDKIAAEKVNS